MEPNGYLTAGELALIENRRGYNYYNDCGYHGNSHRNGIAATGLGLGAGLGEGALGLVAHRDVIAHCLSSFWRLAMSRWCRAIVCSKSFGFSRDIFCSCRIVSSWRRMRALISNWVITILYILQSNP